MEKVWVYNATKALLPVADTMNMHVSTLSQEQSKFRDYFKKLHDRLFESVFVNMAQRSNIVALQDIKENITNELSHHIKNFNIKSLPPLTQSTLNNINETYSDILNYKDIITLTQKLDCDNLYSKRVPQVIAEYISIPEKYRERLSSSVDSPDKLVHENLEEIKEKLTIILDNLNEQSIQNMKKTKKYLKTI